MSLPPEEHLITVEAECRFLLQAPDPGAQDALLVLALHGYGSDPATMLRLTAGMLGAKHVIASLEGPNQFYSRPNEFDSEVVYGWGTRNNMPAAIRIHHRILGCALAALRRRFAIGPERTLLVGFSQPVSMNYRFAAAHPGKVRGVIGVCGGVPKDWESARPQNITAALLHIAREEDEYFDPATSLEHAARLRRHASDVEFQMLPGRHRFPSRADHVVELWLERVFFGTARR